MRECVRVCERVCLVPDVCDDEVGGGDEEVADSLEGCAGGLVNFSNTGLGNYLRTLWRRSKRLKLKTEDTE